MDNGQPKLRVFVDANILVSGIVWPRWPYEILQMAIRGEYRLVLSDYVFAAAPCIIRNRFFEQANQFESFLAQCDFETVADPNAELVQIHRSLMRDIADVPIALAAIEAQVDCMVSEDKDFAADDDSTIELHQQLAVYLSGTFLREMMGWSTEQLEAVRGRTWRYLR